MQTNVGSNTYALTTVLTEGILGDFLVFLFVGFLAQFADGALGMGFGVISSSVLLFQGVPPPLVSASVNAAKIPTGATASFSHWVQGNVDFRIVKPLMVGGAIGGLAGALILSGLKGPWLNMLIVAYLLFVGTLIILRALTGSAPRVLSTNRVGLIGTSGGLLEGIGGSWGPVVTTALLGIGQEPRRAIGSSAVAELVVSATVFTTLLLTLAGGHWGGSLDLGETFMPVLGLVCGAIPAAFLGGRLAARVPRRPLTFAVGCMALGIGIYRGLVLLP